METMLQKWLADNKCKLDKYDVTADKLGDISYADKAFGFDLIYKTRMARVTLTHSGKNTQVGKPFQNLRTYLLFRLCNDMRVCHQRNKRLPAKLHRTRFDTYDNGRL